MFIDEMFENLCINEGKSLARARHLPARFTRNRIKIILVSFDALTDLI